MLIPGFCLLLVAMALVMSRIGVAMYSEEGIILAVLGPWAAVTMTFGCRTGRVLRAVFSARADRETLELGIAAIERAKSFAVGGGVAGTFIGAVLMLSFLNDIAQVGPGMSLMYAGVAWAVFMAHGVYAPVASALREKLARLPS
jgi:hypothetical protein